MSHAQHTSPPNAHDPGFEAEERGLQRNLKNRHIQMIAIGGAIGTGLFYGSSESIQLAGPAIILAYIIGGGIIFLAMRALGEIAVEEPVSGSFAYYAGRFWSPFAGFFSGWNYWFNYIFVSMAELSVVGIYINYWWPSIPKWLSALVFLLVVTSVNLVSVKLYGEFEFWFAIIKVVAIVVMIIIGFIIIFTGAGNNGVPTGFGNLTEHGGFFPNGVQGLLLGFVIVTFSFGGVELIGITAGEADDPRKSIPKAINQVLLRILIFYVGAIFVMMCIFPWNQIDGKNSPFVQIFEGIGIPGAAGIINAVVLTAAVSAYNSGLYSNGRMLRNLAMQGYAPRFLRRVSANGSPYTGVLVSSVVTGIAVVITYIAPDDVFLILIGIVLIACVFNWTMIVITQMLYRKRIGAAAVEKLHFKMPLYPATNYLVFAYLLVILWGMSQFDLHRKALIIGPIWLGVMFIAYILTQKGKNEPTEPVPMRLEGDEHFTPAHAKTDPVILEDGPMPKTHELSRDPEDAPRET